MLILPWTARNYVVFDRFLLLNSLGGIIFYSANHPDLGDHFGIHMWHEIPDDLQGANEVDLSNELLRRGVQNVAGDPWRFLRLSLNRVGIFFMFWPSRQSPMVSNVARTASFGLCLPFMVGGLVFSLKEWRRWLLLYLFIAAYTFIHVISWVGIRYRMPVDVALVPFAAVAGVALVTGFRSNWSTEFSAGG